MDAGSLRSVKKVLDPLMPAGFSLEECSPFVNYTPKSGEGMCRVLRMVGPSRCLVRFDYEDVPPGQQWSIRIRSRLSFLHRNGTLVSFDPNAIMRDQPVGASWSRVIGEWLVQHGACEYTGRSWAQRLAADAVRLIGEWTPPKE